MATCKVNNTLIHTLILRLSDLKTVRPNVNPAIVDPTLFLFFIVDTYSRILDTSAPGQIGTCVGHFGTKTNRHPGNSAPQKDKSALF